MGRKLEKNLSLADAGIDRFSKLTLHFDQEAHLYGGSNNVNQSLSEADAHLDSISDNNNHDERLLLSSGKMASVNIHIEENMRVNPKLSLQETKLNASLSSQLKVLDQNEDSIGPLLSRKATLLNQSQLRSDAKMRVTADLTPPPMSYRVKASAYDDSDLDFTNLNNRKKTFRERNDGPSHVLLKDHANRSKTLNRHDSIDVLLESKNSKKLLKNTVKFHPTQPLQNQTIDEIEDRNDVDEKLEAQLKSNLVFVDENAPKTDEILEVTEAQMQAYKKVDWKLRRDFVERLEKIEVYQGMDKLQRDKLHALFTEKQIKEVNEIDVEYGYNFKDETMEGCFEALNSLPRSSMRKLV